MRTKTLSTREIKAFFKDDLKHGQKILLVEFILMAIAILFIMNHGYDTEAARNMLYAAAYLAPLVFTVASSMMVFQYLQNKRQLTIMHSLPVSRTNLFIAHSLSDLVIALVPILSGDLVLLLLSQSRLVKEGQIFTAGNVLEALGSSFMITFGVFVFCILATMIAGTSFMQLLLTFGLMMAVGSMLIFAGCFGQYFLAGFYSLSTLTGLDATIPCIILGLGLYYLSYRLYMKRPLENTGKSYIFSTISPWEMGIIAVSIAGIISAFSMGRLSHPAIVLGLAAAIYLLQALPVYGKDGILGKKNLKEFGVFLCILLVTAGSFAFDILGMEKKLPEADKIEKASMDCGSSISPIGDSRLDMFHNDPFFSAETIQCILDFNKDIIKTAKPDRRGFTNGDEITFVYVMKSGAVMQRRYALSDSGMAGSTGTWKKLYESGNYKEKLLLSSNILFTKEEFCEDLHLSIEPIGNQEPKKLPAEFSPKLIKALDKDFMDRTYEEMMSKDIIGTIYFEYTGKYQSGWNVTIGPQERKNYDTYVAMPIHRTDTNTLKWLMDHGYYEIISPENLEIERIEILNTDRKSEDYSSIAVITGKKLGITSFSDYIDQYGIASSEGDGYYDISFYLKDTRTGKEVERYQNMAKNEAPSYFKDLIWKEYN